MRKPFTQEKASPLKKDQTIKQKTQIQVPVNSYSRGVDLFLEFPTAEISVSFSDRNTNPQ